MWTRLLRSLLPATPSFAELRERNHAAAGALSREDCRSALDSDPVFTSLAAPRRDALLRCIQDGPEAVRAGFDELYGGLHDNGAMLRPGTIEEVWWTEGLLLALSEPH